MAAQSMQFRAHWAARLAAVVAAPVDAWMAVVAATSGRYGAAALFGSVTVAALVLLRFRVVADDSGIRFRGALIERAFAWDEILGVDVRRTALTIHGRQASAGAAWLSPERRSSLLRAVVERRGFIRKPGPLPAGVLARYADPSASARTSLVQRREHRDPPPGTEQDT